MSIVVAITFKFTDNKMEVCKLGEPNFQNYRDIVKYAANQNALNERQEHNSIDEFIFLKLNNMFQLDLADSIKNLPARRI